MIEIVTGDLLAARVEALVNPVNCVGVMGKGLALAFRRAFPDNFHAYQAACRAGVLRPGCVFVVEQGRGLVPRFLINLPTKRHWRDRARLEDIDAGLVALVRVIADRGIRSFAIPALGCGEGGLAWADVRPRIQAALAPLAGVRVLLFGPR
jgi:O-acetyl-ADP-ribose deacetylase (regulator of RNase III)